MIARAIAAIALFVLLCAGSAIASERWIVVSDLHVNPFDRNPQPSAASRDTNDALFNSAVAAMRKAEPNPTMVLIGGDFLAHHFPARSRAAHGKDAVERDAIETIRTQARAFDRAFPRARFAVTLGNNDDPCGDYRSESGGSYMRALAALWLPLMERGHRDPELERTFATGGYGMVPALGGRVHVLALNSVYWSFFYLGSCTAVRGAPGDTEMGWLAHTLLATPPTVKNVVLTHIPPGVDATTTTSVRMVGVPFWHERYRRNLDALFGDPHNAIAWAVAGHTHRSDMRLVAGVPMLLAGALSPIYRNQPTFLVLDVDDDGTLRNIHPYQYDADDDRWSAATSFDAFWNVRGFTADALRDIHARLASDPQLRERWAERYVDNGERIDNIAPDTWRIFWCAQIAGGDAFAACSGSHRLTNIAVYGALALVLALAGLIAFVVLRRPLRP